MLPAEIKVAIERALTQVENDIKKRKQDGLLFGDLNVIKSELLEMREEKRQQSSDRLSRMIIDSMDWDQPALKELNHVVSMLRMHFRIKH